MDKGEKREIYEKWHSLINMSQKALDEWAENDERLLASINRQEADEQGGIQSGYDSFHRIKRRKSKPFDQWSLDDFRNAKQEIGFNSRMLGSKPGKPVPKTNKSKWEISLRNWGHDLSLKSSPSHGKWKKWKDEMNKTAFYLKRASLACEGRRDLVDTQSVLMQVALLTGERYGDKTASAVDWNQMANFLKTSAVVSEDLKIEIGLQTFAKIINSIHDKWTAAVGPWKGYISEFISKKGLVSKKDLFVKKVRKPDPNNYLEMAISRTLKSAGDASDTLRALGAIIAAKTPQQMAKALGVTFEEFEENIVAMNIPLFDTKKEDARVQDDHLRSFSKGYKGFTDIFAFMEETKIFGVKLAIGTVKASLLAFFLGTPLAAVPMVVLKMLGAVAVMLFFTDKKATANILRKVSILGWAMPTYLLNDLGRAFKGIKNLAGTIKDWWQGLGKKEPALLEADGFVPPEEEKALLKRLFKKAAAYEITQLAKSDPAYREALRLALSH